MTCQKCNCKVFKPGDGFHTCLLCGQHLFDDIEVSMPSLKPQKMFGNKTQEERTNQVRSGLVDNWDAVVQQRADGIAWTTISRGLGLFGCNSSLGKHYKSLMQEKSGTVASTPKRKQYVNPATKPRFKRQEYWA